MATSETRWLNWPNGLTLSRVVFGLACLAPLASGERALIVLAFILMLAAELTDFLDGYVARLTNTVTPAGKILDPMADSMYRLTIFAAFVQNAWMPAWMFCVFIIRDVGVAYCRVVAQERGIPVASRFSGKAKAVVQGAAQLFVVGVMAFGLDGLAPWRQAVLGLAAAVTLYSLVDYAMAMVSPAAAPKAGARP
jgi:CDP-diacylglycerol--glycerol-3-phosphate 3-phosphatidyltransferase